MVAERSPATDDFSENHAAPGVPEHRMPRCKFGRVRRKPPKSAQIRFISPPRQTSESNSVVIDPLWPNARRIWTQTAPTLAKAAPISSQLSQDSARLGTLSTRVGPMMVRPRGFAQASFRDDGQARPRNRGVLLFIPSSLDPPGGQLKTQNASQLHTPPAHQPLFLFFVGGGGGFARRWTRTRYYVL